MTFRELPQGRLFTLEDSKGTRKLASATAETRYLKLAVGWHCVAVSNQGTGLVFNAVSLGGLPASIPGDCVVKEVTTVH